MPSGERRFPPRSASGCTRRTARKPDRAELERHLTQFAGERSVQDLLAAALGDRTLSAETHRIVLAAMRGAALKATPPSWVAVLLKTLADPSSPLSADAVATLRARPVPKDQIAEVTQSLLRVADNPKLPETRATRRAGRRSRRACRSVRPETFAFLQSHLDTELPVTTRAAAAEVLSKARLTPAQLSPPDRVVQDRRTAGSRPVVGSV